MPRRIFLLLILFFTYMGIHAQDSVLVNETFNVNQNKWPLVKNKLQNCGLAEGFYSVQNNNRKEILKPAILTNIDFDKENFSVETELAFCNNKAAPASGCGMVIGMHADEHEYTLFLLNALGQFKVIHATKNNEHVLQNWKNTEACQKKGKNKLMFRREYNCGYFYLNGTLIYTSCYFKNFGHKFGFWAEGNTCFNADYFIIKKWQKYISIEESTYTKIHKESLGNNVNTKYSEVSPLIAYDGRTLYFSRTGDPSNFAGEKDYDIWYSTLNDDGTWALAKNAGIPLNNAAPNAVQSVAPDNNSMLVSNLYKPDGSTLGNGLSYSNYQINGWETPKQIYIKQFVNYNEYVDYFLSSDNKILLCAINNGNTYGEKDIFVSFLESTYNFSSPKNLGSLINSAGDEFGIYLAADNKTLYFSSYGHESYGSADIFMAKRLDDTWQHWTKPVNLGPAINTENWDGAFKISAKGDYAYMSSKGEESIEGSEDIYRIKLNNNLKPEPVLLIKGKVYNTKDKKPVGANITYSDLSNNKELGLASSNPVDGSYKIILPAGKAYSFLADKQGYYSISENITTDSLNNYIEIERDLFIAPIEKGQTILLNNIFFEFDKADLKRESIAELNRLIKVLEDYPGMTIEIAGHTDNFGTEEYNFNLSKNRASAVKKYLTQHGIAERRLKSNGYGELKPVAENETEAGRAKNRRVEFTIEKIDK